MSDDEEYPDYVDDCRIPTRLANNRRSPNRKPRYRSLVNKMPTPRQIEGRAMEYDKSVSIYENKPVRQWKVFRYPTPTKKFKSIGQLRKRINNFFDADYVPSPKEWQKRKTVNDLALFLGYSSKHALFASMRSDTEPEYNDWLDMAIGVIEDRIEEAWIERAKSTKDTKGFALYMERHDKQRGLYNESKDSNVNININIAKQERIDSAIDNVMEIMNTSISTAKKDAVDVACSIVEEENDDEAFTV